MSFLQMLAGIGFAFRFSPTRILERRQGLAAWSGWLRKNETANHWSHAFRDIPQWNTFDYGNVDYWDRRYRQDTVPYDWYQRYGDVAHLLERYVPKASRIMMAGCGNAVMSKDMVADGYQEIINIDFSSVVIEMMQKKYQDVPQLKYMTMDVRDLSFFTDYSFDAVIDKGTLDSLMCGANVPFNASRMLTEISRVLKPGGSYILITYGEPSMRMLHLNVPDYNWTIILYIIRLEKASMNSCRVFTEPVPLNADGSYANPSMKDDPDSHYVYVCVKAGKHG